MEQGARVNRRNKKVYDRNPITSEVVDQLKAAMVTCKSIQAACEEVGVKYTVFMHYTTKEQRSEWGFPTRKPKVYNLDPLTKPQEPVPPVTIRQNAPRTISMQGIDLPPKTLYRLAKNFVGTYSATKGRFFIRIEADEYYVVGYEYAQPADPSRFQVDVHFHDFNTDLQLALTNLRKKISLSLEKDIEDEVHGLVRYSLSDAPPYNPTTIVTKTKINVPDGEYRCNVSRDLGHLEHRGIPYQFVIPENLRPQQNLPIVVKDKIGTIYL